MTTLHLEPTLDWIRRFADDVEAQVDTLTELDRQVGDGDFGLNLRSAVRSALTEIETRPPTRPGEVFTRISDAFLGTGGTSGPLLGLWFGRIADIPGDAVTVTDLATAFETATQSVRRLGKADVGHKTMVDAMVPATAALVAADARADELGPALAAARDAAEQGAESTRDLVARRGRASYVGDHARGVVDPGARAIAMFFAAAPTSLGNNGGQADRSAPKEDPMTQQFANMDWDDMYRQGTPPWSIGRPQPELASFVEQGAVHGDVLDAGCGHAALALDLAARGYTVVGLDMSATAIAAAQETAAERGLTTVSFARADIVSFRGYDNRFSTIFDSGLLHALPADQRQDYLESIFRAAAPGAVLYILAFAAGAFGDEDDSDRPGPPRGFTEEELRAVVATRWDVDDIRPGRLYANADAVAGMRIQDRGDGYATLPGFVVIAHKPA